MKKLALNLIFVFIGCFMIAPVIAYEPYHATVTVGEESETIGDPNLVDFTRGLRETSLELLLAGYTPTTAVSIDINLRGIDIISSFAENSTTLIVEIPQAGISEEFTGATRDESLALFKDFIRDAGDHHRLLKAYARYSPIDPIAGNPNSLMAQMAQSDYALGLLSPLSGCDCSWSAQPIVHQFQTGLNVTRAFADPFDTTLVSLPLRYSYSPNLKWAFIIDAPITYIRNGGASSLTTSLGVAFRYPVTHEWSLTPIVRWGAGGSLDLCVSGSFVSAGLTSVYNYKMCDYVVSMTNYAGYISSTNLWLTGINYNYHLHNYVFKNGLSITSCKGFSMWDRPLNFSVSFVDSYFAREHLYIRHFDEVGISLIATGISPCIDYDCLTLKFAYQFGEKHYKGYCFNTTYQF